MNIAARLHPRLAKHRPLVLVTAVALWALLALPAAFIRLDTSSAAFFPDNADDMQRMARAMDLAPFSSLLFLDLSLAVNDEAAEDQKTEDADARIRLAAAADAIAADIPPDLAERAGMRDMPDPEAVLRLLPSLVDEQGLETLRAASTPEAVSQAMAGARRTLGGLWSGVATPWLRADPLNFRQLLSARMPELQMGTPVPDPELGYPISADNRHVLLLLRPKASMLDTGAAMRLMDAVEAAVRRHAGDLDVTVVGGPRHTAANTRTIERDVRAIVLWSLAGFALTYLLLVRSAGMLWLLLTPVVASSVALGGMSLLWPVASGLALGFGASVMGLSEDYAVHMHFALRGGTGAPATLDHLAPPLFQGWLLNASGFVVLLFSGIPAVRQLAVFALLSLGTGFALAVTVLPLCPWFDRPRCARPPRARAPLEPATGRIVAGGLLLALLCLWLFHAVRIDVSPRTLGADMAAIEADTARLRAVWASDNQDILVVQGATPAEALDRTRRVADALRRAHPDANLTTPTDFLPAPDEVQINLQRWQSFITDEGERLLRNIEAAATVQGFTPQAFAPFRRMVQTVPHPLTPDLLREAGLGELVDTLIRVTPGLTQTLILAEAVPHAPASSALSPDALPPDLRDAVVLLSPEKLESSLLDMFAREKYLLPAVWVLCCALLYVCLRDARRVLLAALPPLCSLVCVLGFMVLADVPMTLAALAAMPLVLGLAVDHGIVVTHELAHGSDSGIQRAILVSSFTTLTSMGLLALAEHPALRSMGQVIFLGMLAELLTALWLLPRLYRPASEQAPAVAPPIEPRPGTLPGGTNKKETSC